MVKFSIITVCFNSEKTIERTIKSVLDQTLDAYEYIIIDGKSSDGTLDIIRSYEARFNGRLKWVSEEDEGIYDAMNKGIQIATGDIIGIVNSDDYYEIDALEKVAEAYKGHKYCIIYGLLRKVYLGEEVAVYMNSHKFIEKNMITHPTCFISRYIYDKYGLYDNTYKYSADYEFFLRIRNSQEITYTPIYSILSNFTIDGASASAKGYRDTLKLKHKYGLLNGYRYWIPLLKSKISIILGRS